MQKYKCIDYFDVWNDGEGWFVNNLAVVEEGVCFDPYSCTDRELYRLFCKITGYNNRLRSIEVDYQDEYFIEFVYTGKRLDGFYPLGRFELQD